MSGESENNIRALFKELIENSPSILFLDEIDSFCGRRYSEQKDMSKRILAQFISELDNINHQNENVIIMAATNEPEYLDPSLRRAGRFDREISLGVPDQQPDYKF